MCAHTPSMRHRMRLAISRPYVSSQSRSHQHAHRHHVSPYYQFATRLQHRKSTSVKNSAPQVAEILSEATRRPHDMSTLLLREPLKGELYSGVLEERGNMDGVVLSSVIYMGCTTVRRESPTKSNEQLVDLECLLSRTSRETTLTVGDTAVEIAAEDGLCLEYRHMREYARHLHIVVFLIQLNELQSNIDCHIVRCRNQTEAEELVAGVSKRVETVDTRVVPVAGDWQVSPKRDFPSSVSSEAMTDSGSESGQALLELGVTIPNLQVVENAYNESSSLRSQSKTPDEDLQSGKQFLSVADCLRRSSSLNSLHSETSNVSNQTTVSSMYVQDGPPLERNQTMDSESQSNGYMVSDQQDAPDLPAKYSKLIDAIRHRDVTAVTSLINETPELLSTSDFYDQLPQESAVSAVSVAVSNNALDLIKLLLERGADPNADFRIVTSEETGLEHLPPLVLAVTRGDIVMLKTLLRYNADTEMVDEKNKTALHLAAEMGSRECALILVEAGAQVSTADVQMFTPLDHMPDLEVQQKKLVRESLGVFRQNSVRDPTASIRKRRKVGQIFDPFFAIAETNASESEEIKALRLLKQLCRNPECLPQILEELVTCIPGIILYSQLSWDNELNKLIIELMDSLLWSCTRVIASRSGMSDNFALVDEGKQQMACQSLLMRCCLEFLESGEEDMQGKSLQIIDSLIDVNKGALCESKLMLDIEQIESSNQQDEARSGSRVASRKNSIDYACASISRTVSFAESTGMSTQISSPRLSPTLEVESKVESPISVLANVDPSPLLRALSSSLKQYCRCRHSQAAEQYVHWQVYVTKALTVMSLFPAMQKMLVKEPHILSLLECFDKANDPVVLHSSVSILTALGENPVYHEALFRAQVPEKLSAFLASTRALFSDPHLLSDLRRRIARLLVYLGITDRNELDGVYVFSQMVKSEKSAFDSKSCDSDVLGKEVILLSQLRKSVLECVSPKTNGCSNVRRKSSLVSKTPAALDLVVEQLTPPPGENQEDLTSFIDLFLSVCVVGVHPLILLRLLRHRICNHPVFPIQSGHGRKSSRVGVSRHGRCGTNMHSNSGGQKAFDNISLPKPHRQGLEVLRRWIQHYSWDLEGSPSVRQEIRLFLLQLQDSGSTYTVCAEILNNLLGEQDGRGSRRRSGLGIMGERDVWEEYAKAKQQILSGCLPCTSGDAAKLAALIMIIDSLAMAGHEGGKERSLGAISEDVCEAVEAKALKNSQSHLKLIGRRISKLALPLRNTDSNPDYSVSKLKVYLPPGIAKDRMVREGVERHHKLFAAAFTADPEEAEMRAMDQYLELCGQLPGYDCQIFHLKQVTKKKKCPRILGVGTEQVVILDDTEHHLIASHPITTLNIPHWTEKDDSNLIQLDFKFQESYTFTTQSKPVLKSLKLALVKAVQEARSSAAEEAHQPGFSDAVALARSNVHQSSGKGSRPTCVRIPLGCNLSDLNAILAFPEEIARRLTVVETAIYRKVPTAFYLRHAVSTGARRVVSYKHPTVQDLIERFGEVINWVSGVVTSATRADERRVLISSLLRVAVACKNLGNFMGVMEIISGLRSQNLESSWSLLRVKDKQIFRSLSEELITQLDLSGLIQRLQNARKLSGGRVIVYFGWLLKRIKAVLSAAPSVILNEVSLEEPDRGCVVLERMVNMEKLNVLRGILDEIQADVDAMPETVLDVTPCVIEDLPGLDSLADSVSEPESLFVEEDEQTDFPLFPLRSTGLDLYILHQLHHGSTFVRFEDGGNSRTSVCILKLMKCNSQLKWSRARWTAGKVERHDSVYYTDRAENNGGGVSDVAFDQGSVYMWHVREIQKGHLPKDDKTVIRRHGLSWLEPDCCLSVAYGSSVADAGYVHLIAPVSIVRLWYNALTTLHQAVRHHVSQNDQRPLWLRKAYHRLYRDSSQRRLPSVSQSCREFLGSKGTGMAFLSEGSLASDSISPRSIRKRSAPPTSSLSRGLSTIDSSDKLFTTSRRASRKGDAKRHGQVVHYEGLNAREWSKFEQDYSPDDAVDFSRFSELYHRFRTCYRSDLRLLFGTFANVQQETDDARGENAEEPRIPQSNSDDGRAIRAAARIWKAATSTAVSTSISLPAVSKEAEKTQEDQHEDVAAADVATSEPTTPAKPVLQREISVSSSLSLRSMVGLALSSQRKLSATANEARSRWIVASQKKRAARKDGNRGALAVQSSQSLVEQSEAQEEELPVTFMSVDDLRSFMKVEQNEELSESDCLEIIKKYERDPDNVAKNCLSLEGWIRFMSSDQNYAYEVEKLVVKQEEMTHPLSHYFIESSHNTYLTGHQLRGESSVEIYRQVLLTGCRCVELDCWDGEDGSPVIYHGHTLTTKIKFKDVVEAINETAFISSPYPVVLSFENHCSIPQQQEMARLCEEIFQGKLVKKFLFDSDARSDPTLPSPEDLKYRILLKNKKKHSVSSQFTTAVSSIAEGQTSTILELGEHEADELDEDYDEVPDGEDGRLRSRSGPPQGDDFIDSRREASSYQDPSDVTSYSSMMSREATYKRQKETNKIADELSRLVVYTQAVKFDRLASPRDLHSLSLSPSNACDDAVSIYSRRDSTTFGRERSVTPLSTRQRSSMDFSMNTAACRTLKKRGSVSGDIRSRASSVSRGSMCSETFSISSQPPQHSPSGLLHSVSSAQFVDIGRSSEMRKAFQTSSLAENSAKKLCKKQSCEVVKHTQLQLMRVYPAARRFDSSNYVPMMFWPCGIQLVALNYQTEDMAMQLNRAMFTQNGSCGYVLKPYAMWMRTQDESIDFSKFNPWEVERVGLPLLTVNLEVISGQSLSSNYGASLYVEIEFIGVPADSAKFKTRPSQRNAFNPIWNDSFQQKIWLRDLTFVRFTVWDSNAQTLLSQRIVPLRYLRLGYRHLRLRSPQDNALEVASLFIRTRMEEERGEVDGWSLQAKCTEWWLADDDQGPEASTACQDTMNVDTAKSTVVNVSDESRDLKVGGEDSRTMVADASDQYSLPSSPKTKVVYYDL